MGNESSVQAAGSTPASSKKSLNPQYTLRVVIQGDKCTGKSSLVRMLEEKPFVEAYEPSLSIVAKSIDWCFKSTNEQVRCELWDVVESAPVGKKPASQELKIAIAEAKRGSVTLGDLDAQSYDVYRGAHAVILMYDPAKKWTFDMCKTLLTNVIPPHLHVLVLANYRDRPTVPSGSVPVSEGRALVQLRADTHFLECSCKDGFGRTQILSFLNVPFLKMQKAHLEALLARNAEDMLVAAEEFELISFEIDYASYLTWVKTQPVGRAASPVPAVVATASIPQSPAVKSPVSPPVKMPSAPVAVAKSPAAKPTSPAVLVAVDLADDDENLDDFLTKVKTDGWGETIESDDDSSSDGEKKKKVEKKVPVVAKEPVKVEKKVPVVAKEPVAAPTVVSKSAEPIVKSGQVAKAPAKNLQESIVNPVAKVEVVEERKQEARKIAPSEKNVPDLSDESGDDAWAAAKAQEKPIGEKKNTASAKKPSPDLSDGSGDDGWGKTLSSSSDDEKDTKLKQKGKKEEEEEEEEERKKQRLEDAKKKEEEKRKIGEKESQALAAALEAARRMAEEQAEAAKANVVEVKKKKKKTGAAGKKKSSKSSAAPAAAAVAPKRGDYAEL